MGGALTDPSYKGQILMFAYPLIGNYGVTPDAFQLSGIQAAGLVVREACDHPSHHQHKESIHEFRKREGKPGIAGIDARRLTIKTREHGTLRAALIIGGSDIDGGYAMELACEQPDISEIDLLSQVTCERPHHIEINTNDGTIEGFEHPDLDLVCARHHPEAHPGLRDTAMRFFDRVASMVGG